MKIKIYGSKNCVGCNSLKQQLRLANIEYEFVDDYDVNYLSNLGFNRIPVLQIDDKYYNSEEAHNWAKEQIDNYKSPNFNPNADITIYGKNNCIACMAAMRVMELVGLEFNYISDYDADFLSNKGFKSIPVFNIKGEWYDNKQAASWLQEYKKSLD